MEIIKCNNHSFFDILEEDYTEDKLYILPGTEDKETWYRVRFPANTSYGDGIEILCACMQATAGTHGYVFNQIMNDWINRPLSFIETKKHFCTYYVEHDGKSGIYETCGYNAVWYRNYLMISIDPATEDDYKPQIVEI